VHIHASSFDHFNNKEGRELFTELNSAAPSPPKRDIVGGKYLVRHNNDLRSKVEAELVKHTALSITTDGWKDEADGQHLHNLMACVPLPFFVENNLDDGKGESKLDLLRLAEQMIDSVLKIFNDYNRPAPCIIGFATDNPNANKGMRQLLEDSSELKSKGVVPYGCACHSLNNHGKEMTKLGCIEDVLKSCLIIVKFFRNTRAAEFHLHAKLSARGLPNYKLFLESDTRWHYILRMVESLLRCMDGIEDVYNDWRKGLLSAPKLNMGDRADAHSIAGILSADTFWQRVQAVAYFLKPIALCVKVLESDMMPVSMVPAVFVYLYRLYKKFGSTSNEELLSRMRVLGITAADFDYDQGTRKSMLTLLKRRWQEITAHTVSMDGIGRASGLFCLAMVLDQATRNLAQRCMDEDVSFWKGHDFIASVYQGLKDVCNLMRYSAENLEDLQADLTAILGDLDASRSFGVDDLAHPLALTFRLKKFKDIGKALFSLASSAAGGERSFKIMAGVHTLDRNRLKQSSMASLARCRFNSRQLDRVDRVLKYKRSRSLLQAIYATEHPGGFSLLEHDSTMTFLGTDDLEASEYSLGASEEQ
jgi:hypothetical protein